MIRLTFVGLLALAACAPENATRDKLTGSNQKPTEPVQQAEQNPVCFNIVNGTETEDYAAVGLLLRDIRKKKTTGDFEICTGTFVSSNTMITAAHCIGTEPDGGVVFYPENSVKIASIKELDTALAKGIKPLRAIYTVQGIVGKDSRTGANEIAQHDIAVLIFPAGTAKDTIKVWQSRPKSSKQVTIVGFGKTNFNENEPLSDTIVKRVGNNKEFYLGPSHAPHSLVLQGAADGSDKQSLGSSGDSGGPLLIDGLLAGIFSTGGINSKSGKADGLYADLSVPERAELFELVKNAGGDIPRAEPGTTSLAKNPTACAK